MTKLTHNVSNMSNAVKVELKFVNLAHDIMVAGDLGIGIVDEVASAIVHVHCHDSGLLHQVLKLLLDALHDPVEMAAQCGQ